ncbi:MAG: RNA-binding transcriptional accessory protein [Firmicutes bacterium]|nr:RNA-binding transcriptional accessory protein [Bacillota bacterium]
MPVTISAEIFKFIAHELGIKPKQVQSVKELLDDGNTIPFIARYRKEATGELDEVVLRDTAERLSYHENLQKRKTEVLRLISEQDQLTPELENDIAKAAKLQEVEDLYRPYRPKRRTRAVVAAEKGLTPLAELIFKQESQTGNLPDISASYVNPQAGVETWEDAQTGALDIIAQWIADDAKIRGLVRDLSTKNGTLKTSCRLEPDDDGKLPLTKFEHYYDYTEAVTSIPSHRTLAINRGEKEEVLRVNVDVPVEKITSMIQKQVIRVPHGPFASLLKEACQDAYQRLLAPSIERELRKQLTEAAEEQAIKVFAANLRQLLLQPPISGHRVMGVDPAYRTGCKVAVLDEQGDLLHTATIYPHAPQGRWEAAKAELLHLIDTYGIDLISVGNGTASRETEVLISEVIEQSPKSVQYLVINEAGASVYSASELAREELPDLDVSLRGAVSIGRRVQDPLAELVKIHPGSIGVGQYQHDVNQRQLTDTLEGVVESCVNHVGVELNTASPTLLQYVAGISNTLARRIVQYRQDQGPFTARQELLDIKGLGPKTFTQCAGFLRIRQAVNILDNTPVHPESYALAENILTIAGVPLEKFSLDSSHTADLKSSLSELEAASTARQLNAGLPTVADIIDALQKPGRDPREELPKPLFRKDVLTMEDLRPDMLLTGTITNVVDFGAFVDIGVNRDGLIHISEMSQSYVAHPLDVVAVGDIVKVRILDADLERGRISLSLII